MQIADILKIALQKDASDIIITGWAKPSIKLNGDIYFLEDVQEVSKQDSRDLAFSIMTPAQKETFSKNLELDFSIELRGFCRFRVNAFIQKDGYSLVFRPIKNEVPAFESLHLPEVLKNFTHKKNGLVLITGSVWSGKTTTLASLLNYINHTQSKHIITIEDPIEFMYNNALSIIEQREVWSHTHNFENGLKYSLRQAPDVVMIGEMRDLETFRLALRAAETGNLVFATLHTSGAARTIARIIDMFPWDEKEIIKQQLAESLLWVVWQQLLKTKQWATRVPAVEVLINTTPVANLIRKNSTHQLPNAIETWRDAGMISMKESLDNLVTKELISQETYEIQISQLDRYN